MISAYTAYFDESGTDRSRATALTVAGYISTIERWDAFKTEWQEMLHDQCLEYFHMVDLESLKDQFSEKRGWNVQRKIDVLKRAHNAIYQHTIKDFDSSLVWADYDEVIKSYRGRNKPSAYAVLVNACLSQVGEWARRHHYKEPIDYVFESGVTGAGWVQDNYGIAHKDPEAIAAFCFGSLTYGDKRQVIQLQAADVNAYEQWKQMENRIVSGKLRKQRKSLASLRAQHGYVSTKYFDREGLAAYILGIEERDL